MRSTSYDKVSHLADLAAYTRLMATDNSVQLGRLKRNLAHALRQDVTEKQREYLMLYYVEGMNLREISERTGVNISTVSRTMKRGRERLYRCLRYGARNLLEEEKSHS